MHDQYWQTEEAMAEGAPTRALARREQTALPPVLYLSRTNDTSHPRPDLNEFVLQYRRTGLCTRRRVAQRGLDMPRWMG